MAKARMTIRDTKDGQLKISFEYDPPLEKGQQMLTGAQAMMYGIQCQCTGEQVSDATDKWLDRKEQGDGRK